MTGNFIPFVPYEIAYRLKALGYEDPCCFYYDAQKDLVSNGCYTHSSPAEMSTTYEYLHESHVLAPDYRSAFVYLFNKTNKCIVPIPNDHKPGEWYGVGVSYKDFYEAEFACLVRLCEIAEKI